MGTPRYHEKPDRRSRSLFGPVLLIGLGFFLLWSQLNPLLELHWQEARWLWPLLLIFLGLNLLVVQVPRPFGTLLSGLVATAAALVFSYVLLYGLGGTFLASMAGVQSAEWQTESIQFAAEEVRTAVYDITIGPPGAHLYALEDSANLLEGTIFYQDSYHFETAVRNGEATISLAPAERSRKWPWLPDFQRDQEANRWQVGLNPRIPASLAVAAAAGSSELDLRGLQLRDFSLEANAGAITLFLPGGEYDAQVAANAAALRLTLPEDGRHTINLQVSAGSVTIQLPPGMALRAEVDRALSNFNAGDLEPVEGQEGVWQTAGYESSQNRIDLQVHIAAGSVTVE